jgi:methyl-accepting chemotaxis protein
MPTPPAPQTRQQTATTSTKKPQKDPPDTQEPNAAIQTIEQARNYLISKDYILPGNPISLHILAHILTQLGSAANKMPRALSDGILAIALLMDDHAAQQLTNNIVSAVKGQLQEHLDTFVANVDTMRDAVEHVTDATKVVTGKLNEFNNNFQESAEQLAQATQELTEKSAENTNTARERTTANEQSAPTYAGALQRQQIPPMHESVVAKGDQAAKQFLIRKKR